MKKRDTKAPALPAATKTKPKANRAAPTLGDPQRNGKRIAPLPDKRPVRAPRRPEAARNEPRAVKGRQKRKGS